MVKEPSPPSARRFVDQVVLVTGAGGGIGSAISRAVRRRGRDRLRSRDVDAACREVIAARLQDRWRPGGACVFDLTDPTPARPRDQSPGRAPRRIDVLVNNAGVNRRGDLLSISPDDWDLSLRGEYWTPCSTCAGPYLPTMIAAGGGAIVNTASQWGLSPGPGPHRLQHLEGRRGLVHPEPRPRLRAARRPGQRGLPRRDPHADARLRAGPDRPHRSPTSIGSCRTAASASPRRSPPWSRSWPRTRRRSSCGAAVEITGAQAVA